MERLYKMIKILNAEERNFLVCSDCAYFNPTELIDERYPEIKRGECLKHHIIVDNRSETDCEDNTYNCCCDMCKYFEYNPYYDKNEDDLESEHICEYRDLPVDETSKCCSHFKPYEL